MSGTFTESIVEDASLAWLGELGFAVLYGPEIAPGELAAERTSLGEGLLPKRLRAALGKLNPTLPTEALDEAFRKVAVPQHPSLIANNRAFHRPHPSPLPVGEGGAKRRVRVGVGTRSSV
jgi:type I restriction enzyme R subunit